MWSVSTGRNGTHGPVPKAIVGLEATTGTLGEE
jgi:hypothetical protein